MSAEPSSPGEGSSTHVIKVEVEEDDENFNTMDFLELAQLSEDRGGRGERGGRGGREVRVDPADTGTDPLTGLAVCLRCFAEFHPSLLQDHMVTEHGYRNILFKCAVCSTTFSDRPALAAHRRSCRAVERRARLSAARLLRRADEQGGEQSGEQGGEHGGERLVDCPVCRKEVDKNELKTHLSAHLLPGSLACPVCARVLGSRASLREHARQVHAAGRARCADCPRAFRSRKYLANHRRNVHPSAGAVHKCEYCPKEFKSRINVHQHMKNVHRGGRRRAAGTPSDRGGPQVTSGDPK